jgi:membrane-associated phospholipid phosphatase
MRRGTARVGLPVFTRSGPVGRRAPTVWLVVALVSALLFALDLVVVETGRLLPQDRSAELWVHRQLGPGTYRFFADVSDAGSVLVRVVLLALLLIGFLAARRLWSGIVLVLGAGGGALAEEAVNTVVARPRPHLFAHAVPVGGYSFPSGHATGACAFCFATAFVLAHVARRRDITVAIALLAGICTALVALSRVVLGVHYPSDVIGGCLFAGAWVSGVIYLLAPLLAAESRLPA